MMSRFAQSHQLIADGLWPKVATSYELLAMSFADRREAPHG
jgi:hypothetical protein